MKSNKKQIIEKIKQKKEFADIPNAVIEQSFDEYIGKYSLSLEKIKPPQEKILIKEIRAKLRLLVGRFQKTTKNRSQLSVSELLQTHSSTAERISFYPFLISKIKKLSPSSILDLGCGINPIALAPSLPNTKYYASDIKRNELFLIGNFFKKNKIKGKIFICNLKNPKAKLPKTDICLLLKVIDVIFPSGKNKKRLTLDLLRKIKSKNILVSFSTKKLSGRSMAFPQRYWFESLLKSSSFSFEKFSSENEVFYLIDSPNNKTKR